MATVQGIVRILFNFSFQPLHQQCGCCAEGRLPDQLSFSSVVPLWWAHAGAFTSTVQICFCPWSRKGASILVTYGLSQGWLLSRSPGAHSLVGCSCCSHAPLPFTQPWHSSDLWPRGGAELPQSEFDFPPVFTRGHSWQLLACCNQK